MIYMKNFNKIDTERKLLQERENHLVVLKFALEYYKELTDENKKKWLYDYILWLGNLSKNVKIEIENL